MPSLGISSNNIANPNYTPYIPPNPEGESVVISTPVHTKDTIAPAKSAYALASATGSDIRPRLEPPNAEWSPELEYFSCVKARQALGKTDTELGLQRTTKLQKTNQVLKEEYFNKLNEMHKSSKISKILGWVNKAFIGIMGSVAIASVAFATATSVGTALPIALAGIGALAAIGSGVLTIAKGIVDHKTNQITGDIEAQKSTRGMNNEKIKTAWEEMKQSSEVTFDLWKQLGEVMKNMLSASKNMTK